MPLQPSGHPASLSNVQLLRDCRTLRTRRGGPGGQHRNKVETAVVIEHLPSGVSAEANERRSQAENLKAAIMRLRIRLAVSVRGIADSNTTPSARWQSRRAGMRVSVSATHDDFPTLLAEALDHVSAANFQLSIAAKSLGVSTTSLLNLITKAREAVEWLQQMRSERGLPPLRLN